MHMANFTAEVTFPTKPLSSSSSSCSTQFHGRISVISMCTTMIITAVLWARRRMLQGSLPRAGKPHSAISAVGQCHGMTKITRVTQHDMPLHVLFQPTQICQEQIVGAHEGPNFEHNSPELLIIPSHRGTLPQVKQTRLVAQGVVQIAELRFQRMAKVLPCAYPQFGPIFIGHGPLPR